MRVFSFVTPFLQFSHAQLLQQKTDSSLQIDMNKGSGANEIVEDENAGDGGVERGMGGTDQQQVHRALIEPGCSACIGIARALM